MLSLESWFLIGASAFELQQKFFMMLALEDGVARMQRREWYRSRVLREHEVRERLGLKD